MSSIYSFDNTLNFTIEFYVYLVNNSCIILSSSNNTVSNTNTTYLYIVIDSTNHIVTYGVTSNTALSLNTWCNVVLVNNNGKILLFINGILDTNFTNISLPSTNSQKLYLIFGYSLSSLSGLNNFNGYLKEIRITQGIARYTTNYTVANTPFVNFRTGLQTTLKDNYDLYLQYVTLLLHFDTNFNDSSIYNLIPSSDSIPSLNSNYYKYGSNSLYLLPSGSNYLSFPVSNNFAFGSNNFTIEFWFYWLGSFPSLGTSRIIGNNNWYLNLSASSILSLVVLYSTPGNTASISYSALSTIIAYTWYNISIVRNKNNILIFINGNLETSGVISLPLDNGTSSQLFIGTDGAGPYYFYGYIDEFRITNGIARYTSNYILPNGQFPNNSPTQLLTLPTVEEVFTNVNTTLNNNIQSSSQQLCYPPVALSANTLAIFSSAYGNGTYILTVSNTSTNAYNAFDNVSSTSWVSGASYTTTSSAFSTTVSGTVRNGEWIQIQLPLPILLQYYTIQASSTVAVTQSPASFIMAGSLDGTNWYLVDLRTGLTASVPYWSSNSALLSFTVKNNILPYNYFRFIGLSLITSTGSLALAIGEIKLYATNEGLLSSNIGVLDTLSISGINAIKGAYSLSLLLSSWTGPVVNIRNGTSSATIDVFVDTNKRLWVYSVNSGITLTSWLNGATGYVTTWYDQSGLGKHVIQQTLANQPTINASASPPTINFVSSSSQYLKVVPGLLDSGQKQYTYWAVYTTIDTTATKNICSHDNNSGLTNNVRASLLVTTSNNLYFAGQSNDYTSSATCTINIRNNTVMRINNTNATNVQIRQNGTDSSGATGAPSSLNVSNGAFGIGLSVGGTTDFMNGTIQTIVVFNTSISQGDAQILGGQ